MAANDTPATAIDITTVPYSITLDPAGAEQFTNVPSCVGSSTFSAVWWKYIVPASVNAIGISVGLGTGTDYYPVISAWTGTPPTLTQLVGVCVQFNNDPNVFQLSVTPGQTIYFQIVDYNENDPPPVGQTIIFEIEPAPVDLVPAGSLIVSNDFTNFPACIISAVDGTILRVIGFPSFECGYVLPSGLIGCTAEKTDGSFDIESFTIFNQDLSLLIANTSVIQFSDVPAVAAVTSNKLDTFYFAQITHVLPATRRTIITQVSNAGVGSTTWTLPVDGDTTSAIAVKPDGTILYYTQVNGAIHRYDLINDIPLSDLIGPDTFNRTVGRDLLYLADDTILAVIPLLTGVTEVWQLDLTGTILNMFTTPASPGGSVQRICLGLDDPDSFWVMTFPASPVNSSTFTNILIADGSTITQFTVLQSLGQDSSDSTTAMFGPAQSCPLLLLPLEVEPPAGGTLIVGKASNVVGSQTFTVQSPGLTPTSFTIGIDGTQEFDDVPAGVYSIIEDANTNFYPTYYVSNDPINNDNTAIVVGAGEVVDVIIVNSLKTEFGGLYILNPQLPKTNDTVLDQTNNPVDKIINWFWKLFIARDK